MLSQWIAFIIYIAAALSIGWFSRGKENEAFWTAGNSLSAGSVGLSISAGFMSVSWSCVYSTQIFYRYGLGGLWLITVPWIISLTAIYYLSRRFKSVSAFSQPEMAGLRYGRRGKIIVAIALLFVFMVWGGAEIYIAASLLAPGLGMSIPLLILIISVVVAVYSLLGGFQAVVSTDKMQFVLVAFYIFAVTALGIYGIHSADGDFSLSRLTVIGNESPLNLWGPGLALIVTSFIAYLPGWIFETDLWLRIQAAKNEKAAGKGILIALFNSLIFIGILPLIIAVAALYLYPPLNGTIPAVLGNQGDAVFARLVADYASPWLAPLISLGLIAASMSTIDTCTNIMGLSLAYDLYPELKKRKPSDALNKIFTLIAVFIAGLFALYTDSLWDIFYLSSGILSASVALPMAGIVMKRLPARPIVASAEAGFIAVFIAYFAEKYQLLKAVEPNWLGNTGIGYIIWGMASAALVFFITDIYDRYTKNRSK